MPARRTAVALGLAALVLAVVPGVALAAPTETQPSPTATTTSPAAKLKLAVTQPGSGQAQVSVTITGARDGQSITVAAFEVGRQGNPHFQLRMVQQGNGATNFVIDSPQGGWPAGKEFRVQVTSDGTTVSQSFSYARKTSPTTNPSSTMVPKPSDKASKTTAPKDKDRTGGIARTGV